MYKIQCISRYGRQLRIILYEFQPLLKWEGLRDDALETIYLEVFSPQMKLASGSYGFNAVGCVVLYASDSGRYRISV